MGWWRLLGCRCCAAGWRDLAVFRLVFALRRLIVTRPVAAKDHLGSVGGFRSASCCPSVACRPQPIVAGQALSQRAPRGQVLPAATDLTPGWCPAGVKAPRNARPLAWPGVALAPSAAQRHCSRFVRLPTVHRGPCGALAVHRPAPSCADNLARLVLAIIEDPTGAAMQGLRGPAKRRAREGASARTIESAAQCSPLKLPIADAGRIRTCFRCGGWILPFAPGSLLVFVR